MLLCFLLWWGTPVISGQLGNLLVLYAPTSEGETLLLHSRCPLKSVQHKWQGEQRKTEKDKWRVAGLLQVSPVIKSVYSLHVNPSFHTCQLPGPRPILDPSFTKESLTDTLCVYFKSAWWWLVAHRRHGMIGQHTHRLTWLTLCVCVFYVVLIIHEHNIDSSPCFGVFSLS